MNIWDDTDLKLCLADALHNFKSVKIIQICQNGGRWFWTVTADLLCTTFCDAKTTTVICMICLKKYKRAV